MGLFRRKPLHQRLAEEGGLVEPSTRPLFTGVIGEAGIHGVPRRREYDAVVTLEAPDVQGASTRFVGLPDGSHWIRDELDGEAGAPAALGAAVGERLLAAGAAELLAEAERVAFAP